MRRQVFTRWLGICLGAVFVLLGVAETIRVFVSGDGGLVLPVLALLLIALRVMGPSERPGGLKQ
ncbi:hypothetical protein EV643_10730 [Kribbella sp. VKM Ac-2527]|uniref:Uncharacterized protein n=1 Tax=Kribbella caucasensis TaxID=2512215 RepID=A0A4R6KD65_9ACTN|nr:hypothetical protein EV643_10730 [Kribbella sp. VKM Ac-2527]